MAIRVYNTLSRKKEIFEPIHKDCVNFYVCGPTVYNYIHIGNARSAVCFDTIRRYLEYKGYRVNYVSNFTDVDDKIIKAAKEEGLTPKALADKYIQAYREDVSAINVQEATVHPRVMDNIPEIIDYIQVLIDKGYAYESQGDVYYRTEKFKDYGQLSDQSIADLKIGASERLAAEDAQLKESPLDFALWKRNKDQSEISWESPWGLGRPGWHIECSVMSTKYLGQELDIHGGGQDLQFPHHENEIAQSEAYTDHHPFAKYWLHNGFVTIGQDDEKMSKSLGNFVLLRELLEKEDPMVIRYLLSSVHYRRPLRYDQNALDNAKAELKRIREVMQKITYRKNHLGQGEVASAQTILATFDQKLRDFELAMDDDFNTANALSALFEMIKSVNQYLDLDKVDEDTLSYFETKLSQLLAIFGLAFLQEEGLDETIEALIKERQQARLDRDFVRADAIRDELKEMGIILDDTQQGTRWKRV
ncbi:cysteine--tRNA ligase [Facklamia hominis]